MPSSVISRTRKKKHSRYLFLVVAIACLGLDGYAYLDRVLFQNYQSWLFERASNRVNAPSAESIQQPGAASHLASGIIGRLSVPRLHLSAMVAEGVDAKTLRLSVGHIPMTALPGQTGNVGVAGHRDTFFRALKDLRAKDRIVFLTSTGTINYEVVWLSVVGSDDVSVLAPSAGNTLTMVTCYPFSYIGRASQRFIVRARQVSRQTQPPPQPFDPGRETWHSSTAE